MARYEEKYTDDDFKKALDPEVYCTVGYIARKVGSSPATARKYLDRLKHENVAESMLIDFNMEVWRLKTQV